MGWDLGAEEPNSPPPRPSCPSLSRGGFPPGTGLQVWSLPPPQSACSGLVRCHDNLEPPSPTAKAPLKNLSGKLPCLKINHGIEILKMSCFGQWNWGTGAKFFCPGARGQLQPTPPRSAGSKVLLPKRRLGRGREAGRQAPRQQVPRVTLHPISCWPLTWNTSEDPL